MTSAPPPSAAPPAPRRRRRRDGSGRRRRRRPLRLYEHVETLTSFMWASRPWSGSARLVRAVPAVWPWRANPAGLVVGGARVAPDTVAIVDADRRWTYADLDRRTDAIAATWQADGIGPGTVVAILVGNRGSFLEAMMAAHKVGADLVFANTAFAGPQLADVVARHDVDVVVHDDAHAAVARAAAPPRLVSAADLEAAAASVAADRPATPPAGPGRVVVLTSGTTGRPKGAVRDGGNPLDVAAVLSCIPIIRDDVTLVASPLFHGLGLFMASVTLSLRSTVVLDPEFDAEATLARIAATDASVLVVVPAMLRRIMDLPDRTRARHDTSSLRVIVCGGAALSGDLARTTMDHFGDVLFNVYGSTEVAMATVAGPRDLRRAPGTAGRAVPGVAVRVLGDDDRPVPPGETGRVFVGSRMRFDGYVDGATKAVVHGLVSTGDLGRLDPTGRLWIAGRDDDMIVSGGENVFPLEVEETLFAHPDVVEVAVVGVADDEFGQRLRALVVPRAGTRPTGDDLRQWVRDRLARFKVPRDVVFVDALPRGATGKVLTPRLHEVDWLAAARIDERSLA